MFDENYYQNKKKQIENKITKKVFDFYNQVKQGLIAIDQDINGINQDLQEVEQQIQESKKNGKTQTTQETRSKPKVEKKNTDSKLAG